MQTNVYDVTLYWHTGGSVFLGTVAARGIEDAKDRAKAGYIQKSKKNAREIEEGGGYQLEAEPLFPSEAARWIAQNT